LKLLLAASAHERMRLIQFLERLEADPFREGDFQIQDESGRTQQVSCVSGFLITFYSDHAVKEVRVTEIE
jgi:hypothetical protein